MIGSSRLHRMIVLGGILCLSLYSAFGQANDKNATFYRPDGNWNVEGANGQLYVFGALTESPCRIAMESSYQSVDMGNIETATLKNIGSRGQAVPFHIQLLDCIETPTDLIDRRTDTRVWSSLQPGVKVRFLASSVPFYPQLIRVTGAQGFGLQLSDADGRIIPLGEDSFPRLLTPGQDNLTYFITPVRVSHKLLPDAYHALISFELIYD
ncbi:fimbrial protein [Moellerella wisconsensis]|uniref:Type 1 fimbrial protein n=3 Tax=Moellerella wisconsensis TaxID=158849 RepID=A0ACD3Y5A7_9GAMM|nr:fimbrial protein [Moellerella wisconsensis]KLN98293.1 MrfX protein [Moellerella wisconsensis]UNH23543.1 type 1 fimbrial protein [Moellerella wisconsensis]UNH26630.1 type 1 fimbrial protein [Moellerella wisconsensis]UNH30040.1 type 1 fimbrial protein [Moellerella wisconsensis]UNH38273.1 type 1 fimbrial protein [Moellerella wisconsensis]